MMSPILHSRPTPLSPSMKSPVGKRIRKCVKSVSFHPEVHCYEVLSLSRYTEEEIRSVWYSKEEFKCIKKEVNQTVKIMESGVASSRDSSQHCCRGLEHRTSEGAHARKEQKMSVTFAVFREQMMQHHEGTQDCEIISQKSRELSDQCQLAAISRAATDRKFVTSQVWKQYTPSKKRTPAFLRRRQHVLPSI